MTMTLRNDFHGTEARVRVRMDARYTYGIVSERAMRAAGRKLCGIPTCTCSGPYGTRGPQEAVIEPVYHFGEPDGVHIHAA